MAAHPDVTEDANTQPQPREVARGWKRFGAAALILSVGAVVGWAATVVFASPPAIQDANYTLVTVEQGTVAASQAMNTRATWQRTFAATNTATGTVTAVPKQTASPITAGTTLYEVDLHPVVVLEGEVPAFRDMTEAASGDDIAQLQKFLSKEGYLDWFTSGRWEAGTTAAVKRWQDASGMEVDGIVNAGEVVFVRSLPSGIALDTSIIQLGAPLAGGERAIYKLGAQPSFIIPLTDAQAGTIPIGSRVEINSPNGDTWAAWVTEQQSASADDGTNLILGADNDTEKSSTAICGDACADIPISTNGVLLRSRVITVESVDGLTVPSAAITTSADGSTILIDETGTEHEVTVLAGAKGMTAIEGVDAGLRVRAPAEAQ